MTLKIKLAAALLSLLLLSGWAIYTVSLRADRDRLGGRLEAAEQSAREAIETLTRERAAWRSAALAVTIASQAQGDAYRADMERRALIDEISRDCTIVVVPEGSIDEQTSGKVVEMFNNRLFAPLGGGVRAETN